MEDLSKRIPGHMPGKVPGNTSTVYLEEMTADRQDRLVILPYAQKDADMHDHNFFELVYVTKGSGLQKIDAVSCKLKEGDYFILDYGTRHSYSQSDGLKLINCLFLPEVMDETLRGCRSFEALMKNCMIRYDAQIPGCCMSDCVLHDSDGRIRRLLGDMLTEYQKKSPGYAEIFRCCLRQILILSMRSVVKNHQARPKSEVIQAAVRYIEENYAGRVTLGEFCAGSHFSLSYISRKFCRETGITFREYLQKVRIAEGCRLLEQSDLRITEVAARVGYEDVKSFQQAFHKLVQVSPREYRKSAE